MVDLQTIIVFLLFLGALAYVGRIIFKSLNTTKGCGSSCKCGVDFSNIDMNKKS
jgi:hypothetical protein